MGQGCGHCTAHDCTSDGSGGHVTRLTTARPRGEQALCATDEEVAELGVQGLAMSIGEAVRNLSLTNCPTFQPQPTPLNPQPSTLNPQTLILEPSICRRTWRRGYQKMRGDQGPCGRGGERARDPSGPRAGKNTHATPSSKPQTKP